MTSIKLKFRPSTVALREGSIYYQIIHDRIPRQLRTPYKIFPEEWDEKLATVTELFSARKPIIRSIRESISRDFERLSKIIHNLESNGLTYSTDDIIREHNRYTKDYTLFTFMEHIIANLKSNGKLCTAENYTSALKSFRTFRNNEDIMLDCIDSNVMEAYEAWLHRRGVVPNTISFYARILRATYNRALEDKVMTNRYPFRHVYTGIDKTMKRALPLTSIRRIRDLDLSESPSLDYARDMFMLSFMLRGMSFIDMAYLLKSDLSKGYITYRRRKTGQLLSIAWTREMQKILDKYPENKSDYLLPILTTPGISNRTAYRNIGYIINNNLKRIAKKAGIPISLSLYVARHSWASIARSKGIPINVISEGMGHDSEATTRIYLASLDTSIVDKANSKILSCLFYQSEEDDSA